MSQNVMQADSQGTLVARMDRMLQLMEQLIEQQQALKNRR